MKKSLIALAVLAASGAAMAQSSVTLYGIVDAYVGSKKDTTGAAGNTAIDNTKQNQTMVESGGLKSNRWGLKGSEDLGNGLKASFKLEQRFKSDDGSLDGPQNFKGESSLSLEGGFGKLTVGRTTTVYDDLRDLTNTIGDTSLSPVIDSIKEAKGDYTDTTDNTIAYRSPVFGGFSGGVSVALGENKSNIVDASQNTAFTLQYKDGPLLVGYGYQNEETQNGTGMDDKTFNLFAASYDFGVAKLVGGYQTEERETLGVKTGDTDSYYFGVQAPVAKNVNLYFGYVNSTWDAVAANGDVKATGFTIAANYVLTKRTDLYVGFKQIKKENDNTGADLGKISQFALGVRHAF